MLERQSYREERVLSACDPFRLEIEHFCSGAESADVREGWRREIVGQAELLERVRESA